MKKLTYLFVAASLTACGTQPPVSVVDGYKTKTYQSTPTFGTNDDFVLGVVESQELPEVVVEKPVNNQPQARTYTVQEGDSLSQISAFFHVDADELLEHNKLVTARQVVAGRVLEIPMKKQAVNASAESGTPSVDSMLNAAPVSSAKKPYKLTDKFVSTQAKSVQKPMVKIPAKLTKHTIKAGENIFRIGLKYGVSQFDIINANDGVNPADLRIGQQIIIPMKGNVAPVASKNVAIAEKPVVAKPKPAPAVVTKAKQLTVADYKSMVKNAPKVRIPRRGMMWPVNGKLIKTYGNKERGVTHSGINIAVAPNTPIRAADGGKVIYSDSGLEQYGNLILIRHSNGYVTAYAHNTFNNVKRNQWVKKGDVIALAGNSGLVEKPQLHFEVRKNAQAINPLKVLPKK